MTRTYSSTIAWNKAQQAAVDRNSILIQAAKIIDPGCFSEPVIQASQETIELANSRRRYMQARAMRAAWEILRLASKSPDLKKELVAEELAGWSDLGIPIERPELRKVIEAKHDTDKPTDR